MVSYRVNVWQYYFEAEGTRLELGECFHRLLIPYPGLISRVLCNLVTRQGWVEDLGREGESGHALTDMNDFNNLARSLGRYS